VLWAAGVRASGLTEALGVPLDNQRRVIVESDCSIPGRPEVFAIGDMARFEEDGAVLPGVSPVALQQARYVARLIRWELESDGRPPRAPFSYFDKGSMATIGRSRAIAWARGIKMRGFIAWLAWLVVHIWYLIGFRNRLVVLFTWAWSYVAYKRGARLITKTGWHAAGETTRRETGATPETAGSRAKPRRPSPPEAGRSPESGGPRGRAASPPG